MRHRKHSHTLGVKKEHRAALMANLAAALLTHGRIQTTLAKAKALRPFVEKVITMAKNAQKASPERALYLKRLALARVRDKKAVQKLFEERAEEFASRSGGYTRIYKLGARVGDAAETALIELIDASDEGYRSNRRKSKKKVAKKEAAPAPSEEKAAEETAPEGEAAAVEETATEAEPEAEATETEEAPAEETEVKAEAEESEAEEEKEKKE